jgi:hypothetical protein
MPASDNNKKIDDEFVPRETKNNNCNDKFMGGTKSVRSDYIAKTTTGDDDYPEEACDLFYHGNAQIDNLQVNTEINGTGNIDISGTVKASEVTASGITLTSRKPFDIPHPTKSGHRLRHVCLEGPESAVYYRGRLVNNNVIELPEYWTGLVDPQSITVSLTQIMSSQDLIVDKIEGCKRIMIKSGSAVRIDCYFLVHGERIDGEKLIVEYEGNSIDDYPGDNSIYSINK